MLTDNMKYKILRELAKGPLTKTILGNMVKSRGIEYKNAMFSWLDGKVTDKYRLSPKGMAATIYCLTPSGADELERLKGMFIE